MIWYPVFTSKHWEAMEVEAETPEEAVKAIHRKMYNRDTDYHHRLWWQHGCRVCAVVGGDPSKKGA